MEALIVNDGDWFEKLKPMNELGYWFSHVEDGEEQVGMSISKEMLDKYAAKAVREARLKDLERIEKANVIHEDIAYWTMTTPREVRPEDLIASSLVAEEIAAIRKEIEEEV